VYWPIFRSAIPGVSSIERDSEAAAFPKSTQSPKPTIAANSRASNGGFLLVGIRSLLFPFSYCTTTLKLAGEPGATPAVAVDPFGLDSVPSAICAVAANVCMPAFNVTGRSSL
jgi:hypothetical protein